MTSTAVPGPDNLTPFLGDFHAHRISRRTRRPPRLLHPAGCCRRARVHPSQGGEVTGFKTIGAGKRITFTVTVPGSDCVAAVSARVGESRRDGRVNLCDKGGYVLIPAEGGTKFLPLSQVMLVR